MEGADQVLALRVVHRHLAPDGGIGHGDQGGGHLNQGQAAKEGGGDEAGQVPHHPSPQGDDGMPPFGAALHQPIVEPGCCVHGL